jgi:urocanate hydratase
MGVIRHADAGYERAVEEAEVSDVAVPMRDRTGSGGSDT